MYHILWQPRQGMNGSGFTIELLPEWKERISKSEITADKAQNMINRFTPLWLENHGYNLELHKYGSIKFIWDDDWGIRSLSVPGNACGLDLGSGMGLVNGGMALEPHNIDSLRQSSMLLTIFSQFADYLMMEKKQEEFK